MTVASVGEALRMREHQFVRCIDCGFDFLSQNWLLGYCLDDHVGWYVRQSLLIWTMLAEEAKVSDILRICKMSQKVCSEFTDLLP
jgi:hypothetical protein